MQDQIFIAGTVRTPIGKFGGALSKLDAAKLGSIAGSEALWRAQIDPSTVDEVIVSNARQAGTGPNLGRQVAARTGLPQEIPGYTVNMACGSGLKAVELAFNSIAAGKGECVLVVGTESMSRIPYILDGARWGYKLGNSTLHDALYRDGFICALSNQHMGMTAEHLADVYGISREESDAFAVKSHAKAVAAIEDGAFNSQVIPVAVPGRRGETLLIEEDECPRPDTSPEKVAGLPPVFTEEGQVTAGNASAIADGAAAMVVMSGDYARRNGLTPGTRILAFSQVGVDPNLMGIGPVPAVKSLLADIGGSLSDFNTIELNEAFAVQALACLRDLGLDEDVVNPHGGAIALGHPIGMTGIRMLVNLDHHLSGDGKGLATLCINGGMGMAVAVESAG